MYGHVGFPQTPSPEKKKIKTEDSYFASLAASEEVPLFSFESPTASADAQERMCPMTCGVTDQGNFGTCASHSFSRSLVRNLAKNTDDVTDEYWDQLFNTSGNIGQTLTYEDRERQSGNTDYRGYLKGLTYLFFYCTLEPHITRSIQQSLSVYIDRGFTHAIIDAIEKGIVPVQLQKYERGIREVIEHIRTVSPNFRELGMWKSPDYIDIDYIEELLTLNPFVQDVDGNPTDIIKYFILGGILTDQDSAHAIVVSIHGDGELDVRNSWGLPPKTCSYEGIANVLDEPYIPRVIFYIGLDTITPPDISKQELDRRGEVVASIITDALEATARKKASTSVDGGKKKRYTHKSKIKIKRKTKKHKSLRHKKLNTKIL
jgi:hypothetical protein